MPVRKYQPELKRVYTRLKESLPEDLLVTMENDTITVLNDSGAIWGTFRIDERARYILVAIDQDTLIALTQAVTDSYSHQFEG